VLASHSVPTRRSSDLARRSSITGRINAHEDSDIGRYPDRIGISPNALTGEPTNGRTPSDPITMPVNGRFATHSVFPNNGRSRGRSEEHTSELQSRENL